MTVHVMFRGNVIDPNRMAWWFNMLPSESSLTPPTPSTTPPNLSEIQNGFCVRETRAVDYSWVIFFCHGKYIVSCSRGWKKNSLSSFFNEVPNVNPILLSRADSKAPILKADCPSAHLQVMWKQAALERKAA